MAAMAADRVQRVAAAAFARQLSPPCLREGRRRASPTHGCPPRHLRSRTAGAAATNSMLVGAPMVGVQAQGRSSDHLPASRAELRCAPSAAELPVHYPCDLSSAALAPCACGLSLGHVHVHGHLAPCAFGLSLGRAPAEARLASPTAPHGGAAWPAHVAPVAALVAAVVAASLEPPLWRRGRLVWAQQREREPHRCQGGLPIEVDVEAHLTELLRHSSCRCCQTTRTA